MGYYSIFYFSFKINCSRKIHAAGAVPVLKVAGFQQAREPAYMELTRCDRMVLHVVHSVLEAAVRALPILSSV